MRKFWFGFLGTFAAAVALQFTQANVNAGLFSDCSPCDPCEAVCETNCDPCEPVCGSKGKWFVNGFIESGFWANEYGNKNLYLENGRRDLDFPGNTAFLQNVQHTGYQVNQTYISAGKAVDGKHGWDFGGTVDFVFGTDARYVQSQGLEITASDPSWGTGDYYSAFAQAYFEAAYKKWDFKVGKFYAPFGAQGFRGDNNFFYSFAPNWSFVPATGSGAYATYAANSKLTVYGGYVIPDGFFDDRITAAGAHKSGAALGGIVYQATKKLNLHYAFAIGGAEADNALGEPDLDYFVNSLVATYQINKKWKYVFDWSLFNTQLSGAGFDYDHTAWGINNELIYQYSKKLAFGIRYNYTYGDKDGNGTFGDGNAAIGGLYGNYGASARPWQALSLGANWTPYKWLIVKPEVRWDYVKDADGIGWFQDKGGEWHKQQFSGGVSTVVKF